MHTNITLTAEVARIFDDIDNSSMSFAERLLAQGIGDRNTARPYAVLWAAKKYGEKPFEGQRGLTFKQGSAALQAVTRVLQVAFPSVDISGNKKQRKAAPVRFSRAQRSACDLFLAEFPGKNLAEQIKQAKALLASL